MEDHALLTVQEAAALLRVSRNAAYDLVARGELPAIRLGRQIRISRALIEGWVSGHGPSGEAVTARIETAEARAPPAR